MSSYVSRYSSILKLIFFLQFVFCYGLTEAVSQHAHQTNNNERLELVKNYADSVLENGRDKWSGEDTPLFANGIDVHTGEPVTWQYNDKEYIISNMASQQNLFRMLTGLSNLTGDDTYKQAAKESIQYHFDHLLSPSGLLQWGGHQFIDLANLQPANQSNGFDTYSHEFKNHFPFYELMREVDAQVTNNFIEALWNAHVQDWEVLDMNRHGSWSDSMGALWDNNFTDPDPFFEGRGLTFINAGGDLIYAASKLYNFTGEQGAFEWANNLNDMYIKSRHPETGLGVYQYSKPERREDPPKEGSLENYTNSRYGDRAENQFGNVYGEVAREGWVLWGGRVKVIYVTNGYMMLELAESLGEEGEHFLDKTVEGLKALAEYAYQPEENEFLPMWADGTDLSGEVYPRTGYYGDQGTEFSAVTADMDFLKTYARAYRLSGDEQLWQTARQMAENLGLGDIGSAPGVGVSLNMNAGGHGYREIFALLELYRSSSDPLYIERAEVVAEEMIDEHFHYGYFLPDENHIHANFDRMEPLALLALEAVLQGEPDLVPEWNGGTGYIHGEYDGLGRTYDDEAIWSVTREEIELPAVQLINPSQGSVVSRKPEFRWEQVHYAAKYQLQLTATNFSSAENILIDSTLTSSQMESPVVLEANSNYRWRVRGMDDNDDVGPWSDNLLFYTDMSSSGEQHTGLPDRFELGQNYPNPFNPATTIGYALPQASHVELRVYNTAGQEVASVINRVQQAGYHTVSFDAASLASGVYIYRLTGANIQNSGENKFIQSRKMTIVK